MAINYTFGEAVKIIGEGKDTSAIADIGRRFPNAAILAAKATCGGESAKFVIMLAQAVPETITMRKVEAVLKRDVPDDAQEPETVDEEPAAKEEPKKAAPKKAATEGDTPKRKRGRPRKNPEPEPQPEPEPTKDDDDDWGDDGDGGKYDGMTPAELFKECKKRGISVKPKQRANYYIDFLVKDDESAADDSDDDDDWDF